MISLHHTNRNTKACMLSVTGIGDFYFSYETCIAFCGLIDDKPATCRVRNRWGPTTGRHFNDLGCANFVEVEDEEFERRIALAFAVPAFDHNLVIDAARRSLGRRSFKKFAVELFRGVKRQYPTLQIQHLLIETGLARDDKHAHAWEWALRESTDGSA